MRLVQFELSNGERRVGVVEEGQVREVQDARTVRDLALAAIEAGVNLEQQVKTLGLGISHYYAQLLANLQILPPLDHPDPAHMLVSGTGLTQSTVGAGLLAKAVCQATSKLNVQSHSRASPLPH